MANEVNVDSYGAVGNGVANDTPAFAAAFAALGLPGGSVTYDPAKKYLLDTALTIPRNCTLRGQYSIVGSRGTNANQPYQDLGAIIINPQITVTMSAGASVSGAFVYRKGMTFPVSSIAGYAGTAFTGNGDDVTLRDSMIFGFNTAFFSNGFGRQRCDFLWLDNNNGLDIRACFDIAHIRNCHAWPFATIQVGSEDPVQPSTLYQRPGVAFRFQDGGDWNKLTDCFSYGYLRGFVVQNCNQVNLTACGADNTTRQTDSFGFEIGPNCYDTKLIGCQSAAQTRAGLVVNASAGTNTTVTDFNAWGNGERGIITYGTGNVTIQGGGHRNMPEGIVDVEGATILIDNVYFRDLQLEPIRSVTNTSKLTIGQNFYGKAAGSNVVGIAGTTLAAAPSAATLLLPLENDVISVTGSSTITSINGGWANRRVTLVFAGSVQVVDGGNLRLASTFNATADDTLTLAYTGSVWVEVARSIN